MGTALLVAPARNRDYGARKRERGMAHPVAPVRNREGKLLSAVRGRSYSCHFLRWVLVTCVVGQCHRSVSLSTCSVLHSFHIFKKEKLVLVMLTKNKNARDDGLGWGSGEEGQTTSCQITIYNPTSHPRQIDPDVLQELPPDIQQQLRQEMTSSRARRSTSSTCPSPPHPQRSPSPAGVSRLSKMRQSASDVTGSAHRQRSPSPDRGGRGGLVSGGVGCDPGSDIAPLPSLSQVCALCGVKKEFILPPSACERKNPPPFFFSFFL